MCEREGALAFQYAVSKPFIIKSLAENSKEGTAGEAWRYLGYLHSDDEKYQKISSETKATIAKEVVKSGFSNDFRVDAFLLQDYFELSCDSRNQGKPILTLQKLDKNKVMSCWEKRNFSKDVKRCLALVAVKP